MASRPGTAETSALLNIFSQVEQQQRTLKPEDVAPSSVQDADGLSSFCLVVGWCAGGCLCAAISAGARAANRSRAAIRLATTSVYAIAGGILGTVITGPVLGVLPGSVWAPWGLGALTVFAVGVASRRSRRSSGWSASASRSC